MDTITCECGQVEYVGTNYCLNCGRAIISIQKKKELAESVRPATPTCGNCGSLLRQGVCSICDEPPIPSYAIDTIDGLMELNSPYLMASGSFFSVDFPFSGTSMLSGSLYPLRVSNVRKEDNKGINDYGYVDFKLTKKEEVLIESSKLIKRLGKEYPDLLIENRHEHVLVKTNSGLELWFRNGHEGFSHEGEIGGIAWLKGERIGRVVGLDTPSTPQEISTQQSETLLENETKTDVSIAMLKMEKGIFAEVKSNLSSDMSSLIQKAETIVLRIYRWSVSIVTGLREQILRKLRKSEDSKVEVLKAVEDTSQNKVNVMDMDDGIFFNHFMDKESDFVATIEVPEELMTPEFIKHMSPDRVVHEKKMILKRPSLQSSNVQPAPQKPAHLKTIRM